MMNRFLILIWTFLFFISLQSNAQDPVYQTFKDTRVINSHSGETLPKRKLDIRISHRFGDLAGDAGGWQSFYGLENAADVLIGAEYGVTDNFMIGINRTKGGNVEGLGRLVNGIAKYRVLRQKMDGSIPLTLTGVFVSSISTMPSNDNPDAINNFAKFSHRLSYTAQLIAARKFSNSFSLQIMPGITHRNIVPSNDENNIITLGVATRIQLTRVIGFIADVTVPFSDLRTSENDYYVPIGVGFEFDTGGHVFQVNFTNSTGLIENDYIPYTRSNWGDGEFRLGFTISRRFNL